MRLNSNEIHILVEMRNKIGDLEGCRAGYEAAVESDMISTIEYSDRIQEIESEIVALSEKLVDTLFSNHLKT